MCQPVAFFNGKGGLQFIPVASRTRGSFQMSQDADPPSTLGQRLLKKTTSGMPAAQPDKGLSQQFLRKERPASVQTQQGLDATALEGYKESLVKRVGASQQGLPAQALSLSQEITAPYADTVPLAPISGGRPNAQGTQQGQNSSQPDGQQVALTQTTPASDAANSRRPVRPDRAPDATTRAGSSVWFDTAGLIETVVTATNQVFRFQYDEIQQITTVLEPDGALVLNAGGGSWVRHLPAGGTNSFTGKITVKPSSDIEYQMTMADGRELLVVWSPGGSIANLRKAVIKHPLTANAIESMLLVGVTDRNGAPISIEYDNEGAPVKVTWGPRVLMRNEDRTWMGKEGDSEGYRFGGPEAVVRELNGNVVIHSPTHSIVLSRYGISS